MDRHRLCICLDSRTCGSILYVVGHVPSTANCCTGAKDNNVASDRYCDLERI